MKSRFLIITMILIQFVIPIHAQYMENVNSQKNESLGECIGGWGMCPEQQLAQRIENDQKNVLFVLVIGIPFLGMIVFLLWRKRK
ncbi:hypothetical protein [Nitrosopumilus ureiphilus]|uniref:Uncharacterized protein n=1 Tax=Nitrosopumilus ureiphilus TaxID=1470067 RepID=A0A7D5M3X2_9ARCH|nr:hypothetical protein [Nitrosopumilus ureiphilus]QLH06514.1 hypothetical protein C5F50_05080 [Nitrosopumilus ureiphilus]